MTARGFTEVSDRLEPVIDSLRARRGHLSGVSVYKMLELFEDFGARLAGDEGTRSIEGIGFLANWLRSSNLLKMLKLNLNGDPDYLERFVPFGRDFLAAKPHGLACMWMAGNVPTLPLFSLVPALLAKNLCLMKLAYPDPYGLDEILRVLEVSGTGDLSGQEIMQAFRLVWFDYEQRDLNVEMSLAADIKVMWGGELAIKGITSLPRREHCGEIVFGPKYSIGLIDRKLLERGKVDPVIASFVKDINIFDQRACSSPQTIFIEKNDRFTLRQIGEKFAEQLEKLPPKQVLDPYMTLQIEKARARWALDAERDVIASGDGANWTVCMDREISLKDAVQSRTVFLTEIESWRDVIPLINPKMQTIGIALLEREDAVSFADQSTLAGAARCVRPGLMNVQESPWDGKLFINELVRWVTLKP